MNGALVFLDIETTGLRLRDDIWELAAIRREKDGSERQFHWFVRHDSSLCRRLPATFRADHEMRFPGSCGSSSDAVSPGELAVLLVHEVFVGKPTIVGAVPNFDTERIRLLLSDRRYADDYWHYHLCDVENLAVGYLASIRQGLGVSQQQTAFLPAILENELRRGDLLDPPWDSEKLSRAVRVLPDAFERHTAMGDVLWARAIYDRVMGIFT